MLREEGMKEPICEQAEQMTVWMSLALDDLLNSNDRQKLEQHLAGCSVCQTMWQAMQQVSAWLQTSSMVDPPVGFASRVERRLAERERAKKRTQQEISRVPLLTGTLSLAVITLSVLLIVTLGVVAWHWLNTLPAVQQGTDLIAQVASGVGLLGKGLSLFLGELLRYVTALVFLLTVGLIILVGLWVWMFIKGPKDIRRNGYP